MEITIDPKSVRLDTKVLDLLLSQTTDEQLPELATLLLSAVAGYNESVLEALLATFESRGMVGDGSLNSYLAEGSVWWQSELGLWLCARLRDIQGEGQHALALWNKILASSSNPEVYLSRARLLGSTGNLTEAYADLQSALNYQEDYHFLNRAAKTLARLRRKGQPTAQRKIRLAVVSSTTTDLLVPILRLACFHRAIDAELYIAPYDNFRQEILNVTSGLYAFEPDVVLIATNWRDAHLPVFSETPERHVEEVLDGYRQLWQTLLQRQSVIIIQHNFDLPASDPYGNLGVTQPGGRAYMLRRINQQMLQIAPTAVSILDLDQVSGIYGKQKWFDAPYWNMARQYPATDALPLLTDRQAALIAARLGLSKKVLALDLDNTLWGGIIGEDGVEGIKLGPPTAVGEAYQALQEYVLSLKERGILLVVCSKNNEDEAKIPFLKHDAMRLRLDDFVVFRANWIDKPTNLRTAAKLLNLGIDSFVFLDDNPVERALVRREIPEIAVPELGSDPSDYIATLERGSYFEAVSLSMEDRQRHSSYRANALREELQTSATSLDEFLAGLNMEAKIGSFTDAVLARVVQLIGKTNQFNLTTRRYNEAQIREMMASNDYWTHYFVLKDRFGDNGLIGLLIAHRADASTWEVDTWLMSCRVIGRQMEEFMLQTLADAVQERGARYITGLYIPTAKNEMVATLYDRFGFVRVGEENGTVRYRLDLEATPVPHSEFIRVIEVAGA